MMAQHHLFQQPKWHLSFLNLPLTCPTPPISSLPSYALSINLKITYEHDGCYHKGYLTCDINGGYCFSYKSHINKKHPDWSVPLPNRTSTLQDLCLTGILLPGHSTSSFVWDLAASFVYASSFVRDLAASFVSAAGLVQECPWSLLSALANTHPDRDVWLQSFCEEKNGIESLGTYDKISLADYRAL